MHKDGKSYRGAVWISWAEIFIRTARCAKPPAVTQERLRLSNEVWVGETEIQQEI